MRTLQTDFTNQGYLREPASTIEALRKSGPVIQTRFPIVGKVWITTTYEAAGRVLKDNETFTLRKEGGAPAGFRWLQFGGVRLKKGDKMAMVAAANMDPKSNEDPEKLDLQRHPNRHLAFGTGIHFCLGYQLARVEGKCALEALFGRWPKLELATQPAEIRWRKRPGLRAIEKLPVLAGLQ